MSEIITREAAKAAGLKYFNTGKPCRFGHVVDRYVASGNCTSCANHRGSALYKLVEVPIPYVEYILACKAAAEAVPVAIRARCQTDSEHNLWVDGLWVGRWYTRPELERYMWNWLIAETERQDRLGSL